MVVPPHSGPGPGTLWPVNRSRRSAAAPSTSSGLQLLALLAVVVAVLVLGSGCSMLADDSGEADQTAAEASAAGSAEGSDENADSRIDVRREVRLALTDWTGSRINVAIAEALIERRLGYPVVLEPVEVDTRAMLTQVERGELDAVLELWPSSLSEQEQAMIADGRVDDLGPLGVEGRIGWYVPAYVIEDDPTLASWDGYREPDVARRFATPDTAPEGRFLGTDPSYYQFDEQLIKALDLPFQVIYSGSEEATRRELARATSAREPILLYWWSPTAEIVDHGLVEVELPTGGQDCPRALADSDATSCDYATDRLFKVANPALAETDPELHTFLQNFTLSAEDQMTLISRAESGGESIPFVAEDWVSKNENVWETWFS